MNDIRRSVPVLRSLASGLALFILAGCQTAPPAPRPPVVLPAPIGPLGVQPPAAATPLMTPTTFAALPGWQQDDLGAAWPAFLASCKAVASKPAWAEVCAAAITIDGRDGAAVRTFFETRFVPNLIRAADGADTGLITGYYEPMLNGARRRGGAYQTPLYRVPDDLLTIELGAVYPELKGMRLRGRLVGNKVVPYSTRAEIERAAIAGKELLWVDDPVEAFFLEVQGSGRVQLNDTGDTVRVAYADQNGHPYKAIGRWLVEQGEMPAKDVSAQRIKAWIVAHPQRRQELFNANPSYIFFKEERLPDPAIGPKGALGVALTAGRSVAVDAQLLPLGAPVWLATTRAGSDEPMQRLMMAQDTGGAIRGAVRADFFYGFGKAAADSAGLMKQRGQLWVLLPLSQAATLQSR
ncbi:murein transglycosylase A [Massilia sp. PWRC2]|uniref:murein transglycosylase A n=1 Tax=Massilia sp. PWRC2 TaxID=2804626 RepID=UPI003CF5CA7D